MANRSRLRYSTSALRVARDVFTLSTAEPTRLFVRRRDFPPGVAGFLPGGRVLLPRLRDLLLHPGFPDWARDEVWRELIGRGRADRSSWLVAAMGMAMPGLTGEVRALLATFRGEPEDLESAVAEGFVTELYRVDVAESFLCARLVLAGRRAGIRQACQDAAWDGAGQPGFASAAPPTPWGHPDLVLVDAARKGVISSQDAWLIAVTRLEGVAVDQVAAAWGQRPNTVSVRRHRAEATVAAAIHDGYVSCPSIVDAADRPWRVDGLCEPVCAGVSHPAGNSGLTRMHFPDAGPAGNAGGHPASPRGARTGQPGNRCTLTAATGRETGSHPATPRATTP